MKKTLMFGIKPFIDNSPIFKSKAPTTPRLENQQLNVPSLTALIDNTPKLKSSEALVINIRI